MALQRPNALIFRAHFWNDALAEELAKLMAAKGHDCDIWVVGYVEEGVDFAVSPPARTLLLTKGQLKVLGLSRNKTYRNLDLCLLYFFRVMPAYRHYWMIEFDVRFSGDWAVFFNKFQRNDVDFLGTAVQFRNQNPEWAHWASLDTNGTNVAPEHRIKSFTPVMRLSQPAFMAVDDAYRAGWTGHYEALWPTAIACAGFSIEDIGGDGGFTPIARQGQFYVNTPMDIHLCPGSFVYRPLQRAEFLQDRPNMLWHPVKPEGTPGWNAGAAGDPENVVNLNRTGANTTGPV